MYKNGRLSETASARCFASLPLASLSRSPGFHWGSVQVFLSGYRSQQEQTWWATFSDGKSSIIDW